MRKFMRNKKAAIDTKGHIVPVSPEDFIVDSEKVDAKDVLSYIRGRAIDCFGTDYYYSYLYRDGRLMFYACKSKRHLQNDTPIVAPAFLYEGDFEFKQGGRSHLITNDGQGVKCNIIYEHHENCIDLAQMEPGTWDSVPATLKLKWSLHKDIRNLNIIVGCVLALSVAFLGFQTRAFDATYKKAVAAKMAVTATANQNANMKKTLPDLSQIVSQSGQEVLMAGGILKQIKIAQSTDKAKRIEVTATFPDEGKAQQFIMKKPGAVYQSGNVTYATGGF